MDDMASVGLQVDSRPVRKASGDLDKFAKSGDQAGGSAGRATGAIGGLSAKMVVAAAAAAALTAAFAAGKFLNKFVDGTVEAEKAQAQLGAAITSTGGAAGKSVADLNAHAAALQKITNFGDEATNAMQGVLLTFTQIKGDQFDAATVAILDMSQALGKDLQASALQVGKALNDPVKGMAALAESGIQFTEAQKEMVKGMVAANDTIGAQTIILAELDRQFGGSAEAARNTLGGALASLRAAFGDLFELSGPGSENLRASIERLTAAVADPAFFAAVQSIGTALFRAAEIGVNAMTALADGFAFLASNADAIVITFGLLATTQIPAMVTGLAGIATSGTLASGAMGAIAVAMNLIPGVALLTGLGLALTGLYRGFTQSAAAAAAFEGAMGRVLSVQNALTTATENFYNNVNRQNLDAMLTAAENARAMIEAQLEAAKAELEAASFATNFFGANLGETERMAAARAAIQQLAVDLIEAESRFSMAEHAASNFNATVTDPAVPDAYAGIVSDAQKMLDTMNDQNAVQRLINELGKDSAEVSALRAQQELKAFEATLKTLDASEELKEQLLGAFLVGQDLANVSGQINFDSAVAGAQALAERLSISLHAAMQMMGLLGAASQAARPVIFDPRDPRFDAAAAESAARTERLTKIMADLADESSRVEINVTGASSALDGISSGGAAGAINKTADAMRDQISALEDAADPMRIYNRGMAELDALYATGRLSDGAYALAVEELADALRDAQGATDDFTQTFMDGMGSAIDYMVGDFKDGFSGLLDIIKSTLLQAAQFAIANPIKLALGLSGGVAGAAGGGGGMLSGLLGSMGGDGGIMGALTGGGGLAAGFGGLSGGSGLMGGLGNTLSATFGTGGGIGGLVSQIGGAGGLMSSIGAAIPVIGIAAAAFSFFTSKTKELDAGFRVSVDGMTALVEGYKKVEKSKFWGLSKKVSDQFTDLDAAVSGPMEKAVVDILGNVLSTADALGVAANTFDDFSSSIIVSTKGMDETEAQQAIAGAIEGFTDEFAAMIPGLVVLQREGEGAASALNRLVTDLGAVNDSLYLFDRATLEVSLSSAAAASELILLSGGLDAFAAKTQFVFANMLTDIQRESRLTEIATDALNSTLGALGIAIPETHAEFMALLNAQDLTTAAGRNASAALLDVAAAFVQVNGTAQAAADAVAAQAAAQAEATAAIQAADSAARAQMLQAKRDARDASASELAADQQAFRDGATEFDELRQSLLLAGKGAEFAAAGMDRVFDGAAAGVFRDETEKMLFGQIQNATTAAQANYAIHVLQLKQNREARAELSENAIMVVDVMRALGEVSNTAAKKYTEFGRASTINAQREFTAAGGGRLTDSAITGVLTLSQFARDMAAMEFDSFGTQGIAGIAAAQQRLQNVRNEFTLMNDELRTGRNSIEALATVLPDIAEYSKLSIEMQVEAQRKAVVAGAQNVFGAATKSLQFYFDSIGDAVANMVGDGTAASVSIDAVSGAIGRLTSIADVMDKSIQSIVSASKTIGSNGGLGGTIGAGLQADIEVGNAISAAARKAAGFLISEQAAGIIEALENDAAFAGTDSTYKRMAAMLLEGVAAYDVPAFEASFLRMSDALATGSISVAQFNALFSKSQGIFEDTAESVQDIASRMSGLFNDVLSDLEAIISTLDSGINQLRGGSAAMMAATQREALDFLRGITGIPDNSRQFDDAVGIASDVEAGGFSDQNDYLRELGQRSRLMSDIQDRTQGALTDAQGRMAVFEDLRDEQRTTSQKLEALLAELKSQKPYLVQTAKTNTELQDIEESRQQVGILTRDS